MATNNEKPLASYHNKVERFKKFTDLLDTVKHPSSGFVKTAMPNIYLYNNMGVSVYFHCDETNGMSVNMRFAQNVISHKGKIYPVLQQTGIFNYNNMLNGVALEIFESVGKRYKRPILLDYENAISLKNEIDTWIGNPKKYKLDRCFIFDENTKETLFDSDENGTAWSGFDIRKSHLLLLDFGKFLKEATLRELVSGFGDRKPESKTCYFGPRFVPPDTTFI